VRDHADCVVVGTADADFVIDRISHNAADLFGMPMFALLGTRLFDLVADADAGRVRAALTGSLTVYPDASLRVELRAGISELRCDVVLLPFLPTPSCLFVFLPTVDRLRNRTSEGTMSAILGRLGEGAEVPQLALRMSLIAAELGRRGVRALTARESEIVTRLLEGDRVPAIAAKLFVSQSTVRNHLASVFSKLGVASQQQLLDSFR
jgi:DNA-binding CsgD family transcriptional regulator